jgi:hypothetical protein
MKQSPFSFLEEFALAERLSDFHATAIACRTRKLFRRKFFNCPIWKIQGGPEHETAGFTWFEIKSPV